MMKELIKNYREMLLYTLIAVLVGITVGVLDAIFGRTLIWITGIRCEHPLFWLCFLPFAGLLIVWLYQTFSRKSYKGMSLIFQTAFGDNESIPIRLIPLVVITTWITHLAGGSAGREGVSVQLGATVSHTFGKLFRVNDTSKILLITGMAAGFGGLFQTPIAATFFALEVLVAGALQYNALLPALVASCLASYTSHLLGLEKFVVPLQMDFVTTPAVILKLVLVGVIFGIVGGAFAHFLLLVKNKASKLIVNPYLKIFVMGLGLAILFALLFQGRYSGLGTNLIQECFAGGTTITSYDWLLKFILTILTLAAGFQGGEVTPLFTIGSCLGVVLGSMLGLPVLLIAALGYTAVFASATNTLLAPILIGAEVFGSKYILYFAVVCTIAYVFNGSKSIYHLQDTYELN